MNLTINFRSRASYQFRKKVKEIHRKFRPLKRAVKLFSHFWIIIIKSFLRRLSKKGRLLDFDILFPSHAVEKILFFLELIYIVRMCRVSLQTAKQSVFLRIQVRASCQRSGTRLKTKSKTLTPRFTDFFYYWFSEKNTTVLQSKIS